MVPNQTHDQTVLRTAFGKVETLTASIQMHLPQQISTNMAKNIHCQDKVSCRSIRRQRINNGFCKVDVCFKPYFRHKLSSLCSHLRHKQLASRWGANLIIRVPLSLIEVISDSSGVVPLVNLSD